MSRKPVTLLLERECKRCHFKPEIESFTTETKSFGPALLRLAILDIENRYVHNCADGGCGIVEIVGARKL